MYYRAEFRRFAPNFSKEKEGGEPGGADFVERGDSFSRFSFSLVIRRDFRQKKRNSSSIHRFGYAQQLRMKCIVRIRIFRIQPCDANHSKM